MGHVVHEATDAVEEAASRTGEAVSDTASRWVIALGHTAERAGETTEMLQDPGWSGGRNARIEAHAPATRSRNA